MDALRETIVRVAIPLIPEWEAVTTEQIAAAAGIDEATLLSVFDDKDAALAAALQVHVMTALDPTEVLAELGAIPLDRPFAARLIDAVRALDAYHGRIGEFLAPLDISIARDRAAARVDVISAAVTKLFEPEERLRLPPAILADAFLGMYAGGRKIPAEQLVDLFLHGAR